MKTETAALVAKAIASAGIAIASIGLTWWAIVTALIGSAASFYFEPEQRPKKAIGLVVGIFCLGFAAAFTAVAIPHVPFFGWTKEIPIEIRAGLLGLFVRVLIDKAKKHLFGWNPQGG